LSDWAAAIAAPVVGSLNQVLTHHQPLILPDHLVIMRNPGTEWDTLKNCHNRVGRRHSRRLTLREPQQPDFRGGIERMKRMIVTLLICSLAAGNVLAVGRKKAVYVGGTIESLNKLGKESEGELDWMNEKTLVFEVKGQRIEVAYDRITALEYQNTRKFRTAAIGATVASFALPIMFFPPVGLIALPFALKKKKRHFLTVAYRDAGDKPQALVLELGKGIEREARAVVSARSGKNVQVIIE
jgi:hypothetical protein